MVANDEDKSFPLDPNVSIWLAADPEELAHFALYTMTCTHTTHTFRVLGQIEAKLVHVLVDEGSTLNFIQAQVDESLGLAASPTSSLKVLVGS